MPRSTQQQNNSKSLPVRLYGRLSKPKARNIIRVIVQQGGVPDTIFPIREDLQVYAVSDCKRDRIVFVRPYHSRGVGAPVEWSLDPREFCRCSLRQARCLRLDLLTDPLVRFRRIFIAKDVEQ